MAEVQFVWCSSHVHVDFLCGFLSQKKTCMLGLERQSTDLKLKTDKHRNEAAL